MDYRVFLWIAVVEIAQYCFHVRHAQHLDHLGDSQFVEVERLAVSLPLAPANVEERLHQFAQERIRDGHH